MKINELNKNQALDSMLSNDEKYDAKVIAVIKGNTTAKTITGTISIFIAAYIYLFVVGGALGGALAGGIGALGFVIHDRSCYLGITNNNLNIVNVKKNQISSIPLSMLKNLYVKNGNTAIISFIVDDQLTKLAINRKFPRTMEQNEGSKIIIEKLKSIS